MERIELHQDAPERILSRAELLALGYSPKRITRHVREGVIIRIRRDHYLLTDEPTSVTTAVRIGGRLTCVSAIALMTSDAFVFSHDHVHVHAERHKSRLRGATSSSKRWSAQTATGVRLSWGNLEEQPLGRHSVALVDAVRTMIRCRPTREAIATIDSLLRLGLLSMMQLREIVASLPSRHAAVLLLVDARAESGTESLMRLILCSIGVDFVVQAVIPGTGRVDFLVDGFLIIECDSKQFHEGWERQRTDRRRDLAAASQGYVTLRVLAEDLLHHPARVERAVRELLSARAAWAGK
jgi:very-short-patch-repair endonuclease